VAGYALLIALTLAVQSIPGALNAHDAAGNQVPAAIAILQTALGARLGNSIAALASMAMWFCGLSCVTSASRAVYSLARDEGVPWSGLFRRVNPKHGTPGPAIWGILAATMAAMAWTGAVPVVTSLSTVALYLAYIIPVIFAWRARHAAAPWTSLAVWSLGKWGSAINAVAIAYAVIVSVILIMPPNLLAGKTLAGVLLALAVIYRVQVRRRFKGPEWVRATAGELPGSSVAP
jgi:amino acid transporter